MEKVLVGTEDNIIELTGEELEAFEADREATRLAIAKVEAEAKAIQDKKVEIFMKLGLTEDEAKVILG